MPIHPPLDLDASWLLIRDTAEEYRRRGKHFDSIVGRNFSPYRIMDVSDDCVEIARKKRDGEIEPYKLTKRLVRNSLQRFNDAGGSCPRRSLHYHVVAETAMVELHPRASAHLVLELPRFRAFSLSGIDHSPRTFD